MKGPGRVLMYNEDEVVSRLAKARFRFGRFLEFPFGFVFLQSHIGFTSHIGKLLFLDDQIAKQVTIFLGPAHGLRMRNQQLLRSALTG